MANLCIIQYNNYINRQFKRPDLNANGINTLSQYTALTDYYETFANQNFHKADYVNAEIVINTTKSECDYVIEYDATSGEVYSRWFIIESDTTRAGQTKFILRRDIFVDEAGLYEDAPAYIEKATLSDVNDVAIYNLEPEMSFNQIKQSEDLLKDKSGVAWIVGYYDHKVTEGEEQYKKFSLPSSNFQIYGTYDTEQEFRAAVEANLRKPTWLFQLNLDIGMSPVAKTLQYNWFDPESRNAVDNTFNVNKPYITGISADNYIEQVAALRQWLANMKTTVEEIVYEDNSFIRNAPSYLENKIVRIGSNYYEMHLTEQLIELASLPLSNNAKAEIADLFANEWGNNWHESQKFSFLVDGYYNYVKYNISLSQVSVSQIKYEIKTTAAELKDAPYSIFAIPYNSVAVINSGTTINTLSKEDVLRLATHMSMKMSSNLYDIQLLPYCPLPDAVLTDNIITLTNLNNSVDYEFITNENNANIGIVLYPKYSTFTFNINKSLTLPNYTVPRKVIGQCDKYRLCSPNYAATFDFNLLKTGNIEKFNVDCTYKPYSPYIHVNPVWSHLYGQDFNDVRGLICQGDFSMPVMNDKWQDYQLNNKNYLNAFNRQVESIELQNKYNKIQDIASIFSGSINGGSSGAMVGGMIGGGAGAVAGGVIGGIGSLITGIVDKEVNDRLRNEALDLTKDQFNYNMQNIQALPHTLAKVSAFDANNKIFPVLEYYSCTDQEKSIFKKKMEYNGMTINRIGTINEFLIADEPSYIKGQFIRLEEIHDDYHLVKELANEFYKGVYR